MTTKPRGFPFVVVDADGNPANLVADASGLQVSITAGAGGGGPLVVLHPFAGAPISVSIFAPLIPMVQLATTYQVLLFGGYNLGTQDVTLFIDMSMDGVHVESGNRTNLVLPAGGANSLEIGPFPSRPWWSVSAQSADGSAQSINWTWLASPR